MLSVEECRKFIDGDEKYSDEEIAKIRDSCYGFVELVLECYFDEQRNKRIPNT